jgi:hypothetical protein
MRKYGDSHKESSKSGKKENKSDGSPFAEYLCPFHILCFF